MTSRSTVYAGNYEKVTENGVTREFYYLDGNVIVVKQNDTFTPYLAFTDHLGSVLAILDEYGLYRFRAEYDVWGKPTVNSNLIGFHRGYTGHEMLPEFDLINMNGRLYDPMIGRFLSPDNYVQEPDNSQNFNRYSYCLNNPLKYTDPSGELFGIDDAVFAFAAFNMAASMMHAAAMGGRMTPMTCYFARKTWQTCREDSKKCQKLHADCGIDKGITIKILAYFDNLTYQICNIIWGNSL